MEATTQTPRRVQFDVAKVAPAKALLLTMAGTSALERITRTKSLVCSNADAKLVVPADFHPLIAAAVLAFKQHYPLVLSPDVIWQTILQGVAQHVNNHAEELRGRLVAHQTKIELVVDSGLFCLPDNDQQMLAVSREFLRRISRHVPEEKHFLFQTEFSTTTDVDRIAQCVAIMDTFQVYFDYVMTTVCGIPSVILEGTPEDWALLGSRVEALHASDLELSRWTLHLLPLCDQFVRAANGDVHRDHWQKLCKLTEHYGTENLNGWLLKFIPYLKHGTNEPAIHQNPFLELTTFPDPPKTRDECGRFQVPIVTSDMLPSGVARAPVLLKNLATGQVRPLEFVAGLVGVTQSPIDFSLRAMTGWAICEGAVIDRLIARLQAEHEVLPPIGMDTGQMCLKIFNCSLPADVWRFYSETNGAIVKSAGSPTTCRILPLAEIKPLWDGTSTFAQLQAAQKRGDISIQELKEQGEFIRTFGRLQCIADLGDGQWYVFGDHPEIPKAMAHRVGPWPATADHNACAVFLWKGQVNPESFTLVAPDFTEWLSLLLDGETDPL